ncbi:MAG: hypothetical protein ACI8RZ_001195 [Myxococcota bacterium]|jgi:hypothetical protein
MSTLSITDASVLLGLVKGRERSVRIVLAVCNSSAAHYTESRLTLRLQGRQGHMLAELTLDGGPVGPGTQTLTFTTALPPVDIIAVEGDLRCRCGVWSAPITGISPFQAPMTESRVIATPVVIPAPVAAAPQAPPWERFAVKRTGGPRPILPVQDPEGPWAKMDAGEIEAAMVGFDRHRLDETGQHRLAGMMASLDPVVLAQGCRISRLVRWVTTSTMTPLLRHADAGVRREALDSLGRVSGAGIQPVVTVLLEDPDAEVREAAQICLARITGKAPRW